MLNGSLKNRPTLEQNVHALQLRIREAAQKGSRSSDEITLVAVTKAATSEVATCLLELGLTDLGESRIQEAQRKVETVFAPDGGTVRWHLIGHLQTNKAKKACSLFDLIHSVDSVRLANALNHAAAPESPQKVLLQVNVSGEAAKFGFDPDELRSSIANLETLRGLEIDGLMTMAPRSEDPEEARPFFRDLRLLREELRHLTSWPLNHLSMGMTQDFDIAIEEGATLVRVGSYLLRGLEP